MLKKLLHYDTRAMFRYWWIAALSCVVFACAGGGCLSILLSDRTYPFFVNTMAGLGVALPIFGMSAFVILAYILVFIRFYRNFFTDEGYLTFTLPVGRHQLLNAKLISGTSLEQLKEIFTDLWEITGTWIFVYAAELILLFLLTILFGVQFLYACITLASLLVKKAKVITAIGIYYGASSVLSFVMQILQLFALPSVVGLMENLTEEAALGMAALLLFGMISFTAIFCGLLYLLQYRMLDRKLNLS